MSIDVEKFSQDGILALRGLLPRRLIYDAQHAIVTEMAQVQQQVRENFASTKLQDLGIFQQTGRLGQMIGRKIEVDRLFVPELYEIIDQVAGAKWKATYRFAQILLSLPHQKEWSLSRVSWHLDSPPAADDQIPGIQAIILINDVQEPGQGPLAIAGSHRLHDLSKGYDAHDILRLHSDFAESPEKYRSQQMVRGQKIQIIEMNGAAGDIYLLDPRVLYSPSVNVAKKTRMMATNRFLRTS